MPRVLDYIVNEETISTSKLQRIFQSDTTVQHRLLMILRAGLYFASKGAKPRTVHLTQEALNNMRF